MREGTKSASKKGPGADQNASWEMTPGSFYPSV